MNTVTEPKITPDQVVDLLVYAPLGFALEARRLLPTFVDRGRQQVQMARVIGQFAVGQGQAEAARRLEGVQTQAQRQARAILRDLGLGGDAITLTTTDEVAPAAASTVESRSSAAPQASAASDELAIADYDNLAASHVIPRLEGLSSSELEAVRSYESSHRGRKTILGRIAQIQGD